MKTRLKVISTKYNVNGRVVVCTLTVKSQIDIVPYELSKSFRKIKTTGIAKCMEDDKFDLETGKRIALGKASYKAHRIGYRLYSNVARHYSKLQTSFAQLASNCEEQANRERTHIYELSE